MIKRIWNTNKGLLILLSSNIFIVLVIWFIAVWRFLISADFIPLHYTIYFGIDRFGPKYDLFLFPTLGTIILVLNIIVGRMAVEDNRLWRGILLGLTLLMEVLLLVSFVLALLKGLG